VAKFIAAVVVPLVPAVIMVSAVAGIPAAAVALIDVDIPQVSAVADLTSLLLLVYPSFWRPFCCWHPGYCVPNVVNNQTVVVTGSGVLAVGFTNVPVISCAVVVHYVAVVISVGVTASAYFPTIINIPSARCVSTGTSLLAVVGVLCCSSYLLCCVSAWCCVLTTVVSSLEFFAMARVSFVAAIITAVAYFFCYQTIDYQTNEFNYRTIDCQNQENLSMSISDYIFPFRYMCFHCKTENKTKRCTWGKKLKNKYIKL
jgi:hypothetical protein